MDSLPFLLSHSVFIMGSFDDSPSKIYFTTFPDTILARVSTIYHP